MSTKIAEWNIDPKAIMPIDRGELSLFDILTIAETLANPNINMIGTNRCFQCEKRLDSSHKEDCPVLIAQKIQKIIKAMR